MKKMAKNRGIWYNFVRLRQSDKVIWEKVIFKWRFEVCMEGGQAKRGGMEGRAFPFIYSFIVYLYTQQIFFEYFLVLALS